MSPRSLINRMLMAIPRANKRPAAPH